jgi:polyisoprenyl-teichoic acid--peptidoglycan teichoic acid transferase
MVRISCLRKLPLLEIDSDPMRRPPRRGPNRLGLIVLVVFLGMLSVAGVSAFKTLTFVSNVSTADVGDNIRSVVQAAPVNLPFSSAPPQAPLPGRVNVLLLGYGGAGHDGAYLTDSIMVLTFDQQTKKGAMVSIPRDLWVKVPYQNDQGGFFKLNAAYAIGVDDDGFPNKKADYKGAAGGGNLASTVVGGILGMKIDYWVAVDFHAFKSVVDALDGVDVDIEKAFTDYYYPRNDDATVDASWMTVHFNQGLQHLNGERAIEYARSRHSLEDGTDFGRSRRQQRLLLAMKEKALSPQGVTKVFGLMDALSKDFKTNMNIGQMRSLADLAKGADPTAIEKISIDDTNYLVDAQSSDGQDVLVPQAKSWSPIRSYVASMLLDPAIKTENATIQLWNASGTSGAAGTATSMLHDLGLQTLPPQNADSGAVQQNEIHDFSQGRDATTVSYLAGLFDAKILTEAPTATDRVDIKIVLGKKYQLPSTMLDSYDPGIRPLGAAPPVIDTPKPAAKPAITPSVSPALSGTPVVSVTALASGSPAASIRASVPASAVAKPAATVRPGTAVQPQTSPTPVKR